MSVIPFPSPLSAARPRRQAVGGIPAALAATESLPALWLRRWRSRRELTALDPDQLRDGGLDPLAVRREATKPFWRA